MAVSYIGQASGVTSATLPAHTTGDLIVCFGYRDGSATFFTVPSGWTTLNHQQGQALAHNGGIFYKVAASSSETSGTWTNATEVLFQVYRGADVGLWVQNAGTTLTANFAALTFGVGDGSSWASGFIGYRQSDTTLESPPTGMTNRSNEVNTTVSSEASGHDTNGGVTGWASTNKTYTGTSGGWITYVLELKAASSAQTITAALATNSQTFYGATVGRGAVNIAGALSTNAQTFYGATVAASYAIAGGKFDNTQTFYQATVSPGPVTVSAALLANTQTFPAATVSQDGSTQAITADLVANAQAFFGATVTAIAPRRTGGFGGRYATKRDHDEQRKRLKAALRKEAETVALLDQAYDRAHDIAKAAFQAMDVPVPDVIPAKVRDIVHDMPDRVTTALVNNLLKAIAAYQRQQMEEEEAMILLLLAA